LSELIWSLLGLIIGIVLDSWVKPIVLKWLEHLQGRRAKARYEATSTAALSEDFRTFCLGNIEAPVMILTGSPETPYTIEEVKVYYTPLMYHQGLDYPQYLIDAKPYLEKEYLRKHGLREIPRNELPRLSGWRQAGESADNKRGVLSLHFNLTTFDSYLTTNRSLDYKVIPQPGTISRYTDNQTIRQAFIQFPYSLENSALANPLAVMVVLISSNNTQEPREQVIIQFRSNKVASYRNCYQVSAAGYVSLGHRIDRTHAPSPFYTAVSEVREEISDGLQLSPSDFKLLGLAVSWIDMLPFVYGYIKTGRSVKRILGDFRRDGYEGQTDSIPFRPEVVLSHIAENKWTPEGVLAMCAALLAHFPRKQVEEVARRFPNRRACDFFEFV
jgi:hypothetical protein